MAPARVGNNEVPAYRDEPDVATDSNIETFVALRLTVDNWRWAGVPFYVRTGKRLARRYDRNRDPLQETRRTPCSARPRSTESVPTG